LNKTLKHDDAKISDLEEIDNKEQKHSLSIIYGTFHFRIVDYIKQQQRTINSGNASFHSSSCSKTTENYTITKIRKT